MFLKVNSTVESVIAEDTISKAISLKEKMDDIVKKNVRQKQDRRQRVAAVVNQAPLFLGQKVLRKNIRTQQRKGGKLERSWLGPYEIINKSAEPISNPLKIPHRITQEPQHKRAHQET